jgi:hypothetical protein
MVAKRKGKNRVGEEYPLGKRYGASGREPLMPTPLEVCTASQPALRQAPDFADQRRRPGTGAETSVGGRGWRARWVDAGGTLGG